MIEGSLRTSAYENKDGVKVNATDIVVDAVEFADSKGQGKRDTPSDNPLKRDYDDFGGEPIDPDDTPF